MYSVIVTTLPGSNAAFEILFIHKEFLRSLQCNHSCGRHAADHSKQRSVAPQGHSTQYIHHQKRIQNRKKCIIFNALPAFPCPVHFHVLYFPILHLLQNLFLFSPEIPQPLIELLNVLRNILFPECPEMNVDIFAHSRAPEKTRSGRPTVQYGGINNGAQ